MAQPIITEDQVDRIGDLPQVSATIKPLLAQEANPALVKIKIKNVQTSSLGDRVVDSCSPLHSD